MIAQRPMSSRIACSVAESSGGCPPGSSCVAESPPPLLLPRALRSATGTRGTKVEIWMIMLRVQP